MFAELTNLSLCIVLQNMIAFLFPCQFLTGFDLYTQENYTCPLCKKSLTDMKGYFAQIDRILEDQEPMPREFANRRSLVLCQDCGGRSTAKFDFTYHKCSAGDGSCGSYNTQVLRTGENDELEEMISAPTNGATLTAHASSDGGSDDDGMDDEADAPEPQAVIAQP